MIIGRRVGEQVHVPAPAALPLRTRAKTRTRNGVAVYMEP